MRTVARKQRHLLWYFLATIAGHVLQMSPWVTQGPRPLTGIIVLCLTLAVDIVMVVGVVQMMTALRMVAPVRALYVVLLFSPCVNVFLLLLAYQTARNALRAAGLSGSWFGVKDEEVLRLLSRYRCHHCGYSLIGNVSGKCPECGSPTVFASVNRVASPPSAS